MYLWELDRSSIVLQQKYTRHPQKTIRRSSRKNCKIDGISRNLVNVPIQAEKPLTKRAIGKFWNDFQAMLYP